MSKRTDWTENSIAYGFKRDDLKGLTRLQQRRVIRLMAQISEKSYRRGLQHGSALQDEIIRDLAEFRYSPPMTESPYADSRQTITSRTRLRMEYGMNLRDLGFDYDLTNDTGNDESDENEGENE